MPNPKHTKARGALVLAMLLFIVAYVISQAEGRPKVAPTAPDDRAACWSRGGTTLRVDGQSVCIDRRAVL